jgi:hypothetical protein
MNSLAKFAIDAHGGLNRWQRFETVSAHLVQEDGHASGAAFLQAN